MGDIKKLQKDGAFLPQFLNDIQKATGGDFNKIRAIMPQSSYATALMGLVRNHDELAKAQRMTGAAEAGKHVAGMVGTNEAFAAQQKTIAGQMGDFKQVVKDTSIVIGTALLPALTKLLHAAMPLIQQMATWISHHQKLTAALLAATARPLDYHALPHWLGLALGRHRPAGPLVSAFCPGDSVDCSPDRLCHPDVD